MRIFILGFIFFWCSNSMTAVFAQDYILKSKLKEKDKTHKTYTLLNYDSTGYYAMRFDKEFSYAELEHYDPKLKFKKAHVVTDKRRKYIGVINISGNLHLLYFKYLKNKRTKTYDKVSLYAKRLQPDSFALEQDSVELIKPFKMTSNYYSGNFAVSPDRTKILVYDYEEEGDIPGVYGLTNEITVRVFDANLKKLWQRTVNLSPSGSLKRVVSVKKLRVDNDGQVAILTDVFRDQRSYNLKKITADPTLFFVGKKQSDYALFKPNLGNQYFNELNFSFDTEGNILWFGFFSKYRYYQQSGIFFIKINKAKTKVLQKKIHNFTDQQIANLLNRKKVGRSAEGRFYKMVHWRLTKEGGVILSAEQQPPSENNFKSNDILAIKFSPEGEIDWFKHFYKHADEPKREKVFLSHYLFEKDGVAYLLYNKGLYSDGYANAIRIDKDGTHSSKKFYTYKNQQELFCPLLSFRLQSPKVFICLQNRYFSNYRFALLDFEKLFEEGK